MSARHSARFLRLTAMLAVVTAIAMLVVQAVWTVLATAL